MTQKQIWKKGLKDYRIKPDELSGLAITLNFLKHFNKTPIKAQNKKERYKNIYKKNIKIRTYTKKVDKDRQQK